MFTAGSHLDLKNSVNSIGAAVALFEIDKEQTIRVVSTNFLYEEISAMPVATLIGASLKEIFPRYLETQIARAIALCVENQLPAETEYVIDRDGQVRWWRFVFSPVIVPHGRVKRVLNTCVEITEKKALEHSFQVVHDRFEAVVETAYDGIISIDENRVIKLMNQAALEIFGYAEEEVYGKPIEKLLPQQFRNKHKDYVASFASSPVHSRPMHARATVRGLRKDGSEFPIEASISKIKVGQNMEMTAVIRDISERSKLIEELQKAAIEDGLTGIYNRRHMERIIHREILRCDRFPCQLSLVMFDIDQFKIINDSYGHEAGDITLKAVTALVLDNCRGVDVFGRWGGDEFITILPGTKNQEALRWAEQIRQKIEQLVINYRGQTLQLTCSFGVADYSEGLTTVEDFVALTDKALYRAKQAGRNRVSG